VERFCRAPARSSVARTNRTNGPRTTAGSHRYHCQRRDLPHLSTRPALLSGGGSAAGEASTVARLARGSVERCRLLTAEILELDQELEQLVRKQAPALLEICGCATLSAAKILGETADVRRFRSRHAYARHNGTAPLPVWSGTTERHRLSRTGNRQINAAIHRIAITQAH
jgi:transposase